MKKSLRNRWVKALRSGEYQQEKGVLYGDGHAQREGHCCLGVLLCVADPKGWSKKARSVNDGLRHRLNGKNYKSDKLSARALGAVGLEDEQMDKLINMNDDGISFRRIATWIERHL